MAASARSHRALYAGGACASHRIRKKRARSMNANSSHMFRDQFSRNRMRPMRRREPRNLLVNTAHEVEENLVTGPAFRTPTALQPPYVVRLSFSVRLKASVHKTINAGNRQGGSVDSSLPLNVAGSQFHMEDQIEIIARRQYLIEHQVLDNDGDPFSESTRGFVSGAPTYSPILALENSSVGA